jgi:hypothetical protein
MPSAVQPVSRIASLRTRPRSSPVCAHPATRGMSNAGHCGQRVADELIREVVAFGLGQLLVIEHLMEVAISQEHALLGLLEVVLRELCFDQHTSQPLIPFGPVKSAVRQWDSGPVAKAGKCVGFSSQESESDYVA